MPVMSRQRVQVLHVDDEPGFADLTGTFLRNEDSRFDVETATSADEGLKLINDCQPDCIVSDYNMPGMDGLELLEAVREDNPDLPFILFTGRGSEEVASDAIAAEVTDYLQKGSGSEKYELLANRIRNAVKTRRETQRADRQEQLMRLTEFAADTGGFELDRESDIIRLTAGTRRIIGRSDKFEIPLEEARELFDPDDHEDIQQTLERAFETGEKLHDEWRLQPGNGDERLLDITITPVVEDGGQVAKLHGAVNDITGKKTRERRLAELNQATQALLAAETRQEVADIGVEAASGILDFKANAIHVSEADDTQLVPVAQTDEVATIAGGTTVLPVADSIAGRVYQDGKPEIIEDVREDPEVYDTDTALRGYLYLPLADHGVLIAGSEKRAAFDQQDTALGELLAGTLVAALDRVEREQTARQRQQELALFFEKSPLGAIQWDDEFRFERLNARAEEILGYDEPELRGESWETIVAPDDHDKVNTVVKNLLDTDGGTHALNRNVRKDGEVLTGEWHNRVVTDAEGDVQSIFSKFQDVTERENRKRGLEEYETIIEALTDAVYVIDEEGRFTYVNDEFVELVGYDRETILGNVPSLIKDGEAVEQAENQLGRLLSSDGPETVTFEVTVHPQDGDLIECEDQMGVLPYDGEQFNGSVGTLRDITERKERKQGLQELKDQYETLVENFPGGAVFLINADLTYVRAGGKELRNVGLSPDDIEGANPHALFPEETADEICHYYEEALDGNVNTFGREYKGERYRIQTVPIRTDGEEITHAMAVSQNVTERREREQERERQYEAIFNQTYQFMGMMEPDGTVIEANEPALEFGGLDHEDVIGKPFWKAYWWQIDAETQREVREAVERAAAGEFVRYDAELKGEDENITIDFSIRPVTDEDGEVTHLIPEGRNISELKSLQDRKQELEHQNERLKEFTGIVSHDLRNPLRVADGRLELIREECESDHIDGVAQALDRMDTLIEDLLTLARESEQVDETDPVGLADVATNSWQTVDTGQAALETDTSLTLKADQRRLRQLFENLYRNAVEHSDENVTVSVGAAEGGFYVTDTGPGIPESDREKIFKAGYSTNEDGTGFGLRIVEQIVDAHGWEITVTESGHGGARFEITAVESVD